MLAELRGRSLFTFTKTCIWIKMPLQCIPMNVDLLGIANAGDTLLLFITKTVDM